MLKRLHEDKIDHVIKLNQTTLKLLNVKPVFLQAHR